MVQNTEAIMYLVLLYTVWDIHSSSVDYVLKLMYLELFILYIVASIVQNVKAIMFLVLLYTVL